MDQLPALLRQYWGFDTLRPMQERAIRCGVEGRDSLVVMPTGGGKSLCFQVPPLVHGKLTVVVSPLIALMKDQVDGLKLAGYPAASLNSHTTPAESREVSAAMEVGELRLLYVAPERLFLEHFLAQLRRVGVHSFAIDEAHCISQWGHDFRPEYRRLSTLRDLFPKAAMHAYTATATPRVREDIAEQLHLKNPDIIVGIFDRPNLTYRVVARGDLDRQVEEACRRNPRDATIVYCMSRKETEQLAESLRASGIPARAYHAGLDQRERKEVQDQFAQERLNVVVATVAFGMGIDRSNVRCVVHASHPKSLEAYQQETGRAGRDGLPSECLMLYSGGDLVRWERLIDMSARDSEIEVSPEWIRHQKEHVRAMQRFCTTNACRHAELSEYFGQTYVPPGDAIESGRGCGACDVCLGELEDVPEAKVVAQKITSCVARLGLTLGRDGTPMEYGSKHIADILRGRTTRNVVDRKHDQLSTFGLLREMDANELASCINQLIAQKVLRRNTGEYPTIALGERALALLRGELDVRLVRTAGAKAFDGSGTGLRKQRDTLDPVSSELFEVLRNLRRTLAQERGVPAFVILGDAVLREIATIRPTTTRSFRTIHGVGEAKAREFGERFVAAVGEFCQTRGVQGDAPTRVARKTAAETKVKGRAAEMFRLFDEGLSIAQVMERTSLAHSTVAGYLGDYIAARKPACIERWVSRETRAAVLDAAAKTGADRLKPIFDFLGGQSTYDEIRWVLSYEKMRSEQQGS
jgi:ATP-dependent DNA helicase RecQ